MIELSSVIEKTTEQRKAVKLRKSLEWMNCLSAIYYYHWACFCFLIKLLAYLLIQKTKKEIIRKFGQDPLKCKGWPWICNRMLLIIANKARRYDSHTSQYQQQWTLVWFADLRVKYSLFTWKLSNEYSLLLLLLFIIRVSKQDDEQFLYTMIAIHFYTKTHKSR